MSTATLPRPVEVEVFPPPQVTIDAPAPSYRHDAVAPHHPRAAAKERLVETGALAIGGSAYVVASVVGACVLVVTGIVMLASDAHKERRYRDQPAC
jgi:hypothetical protein